jgi:hypothetical protein
MLSKLRPFVTSPFPRVAGIRSILRTVRATCTLYCPPRCVRVCPCAFFLWRLIPDHRRWCIDRLHEWLHAVGRLHLIRAWHGFRCLLLYMCHFRGQNCVFLALCTASVRISAVLPGLPLSSVASAGRAEPVLFSRMTNRPSVSGCPDRLRFLYRFSFGEFLTSSGTAGVSSN